MMRRARRARRAPGKGRAGVSQRRRRRVFVEQGVFRQERERGEHVVVRWARRAVRGGRMRVRCPSGGSTPRIASAAVLSTKKVTERAGIGLAEERWSAWFGVACKTEECR
jgi:hypothetical protein